MEKNLFFFKHYAVKLKKSGTKIPKVELEEMGPCFEFTIRRTKFADPELRKRTRPPRQPKKKKIVTNEMKEYVTNIHVGKQVIEDVNKTVFRTKALKNKRKRVDSEPELIEDSDTVVQHEKKKRKFSED